MRPPSTGHIFETQLFDLINIIDAELKTYTTQTLSNIEPEEDVVTCKDQKSVFFFMEGQKAIVKLSQYCSLIEMSDSLTTKLGICAQTIFLLFFFIC